MVRPSCGKVATPILMVARIGPAGPPSNSVCSSSLRIRSAISCAAVGVGLGQKDHKLFTAEACRDILAGDRSPDDIGDPEQYDIAGLVSDRYC